MDYIIEVEPEISFMDENIGLSISGGADETLELHLFTDDYYNINGDIRKMDVGTQWENTIIVHTDKHGHANLDANVFTMLKVVSGKKSVLEQHLSSLSENRSCHIQMKLYKQEKVVAKLNHERVYCDDTIISENIISPDLLGRYFTSKNKKHRTAVIVVSGSDGRIEKAQAIAECLAMKGYSTLALCYFGMDMVPDNLTQIPMEYIEHAIAWLKNMDTVDADQIGIYGRSKGGEMALLAASMFTELKFVVANTPSNYVQEGIIAGMSTSRHSSWCYDGNEIAFIKVNTLSILQLLLGFIRKDQFAFRKFYQKLTWKDETAKNQLARISVEKKQAKVLLLSSDTDGIWPSDEYAAETQRYMIAQGKENKCHSFCYHGSGHMLTLPYQPIPNCEEYGGILEKGVLATMDAWEKTLQFLSENYH